MNQIDKVIKEIAEPILEQLKKMNKEDVSRYRAQIPKIRFIREDGSDEPVTIDGVEINEHFIKRLEEYLQEELEMLEEPTILH